MSRATSHRLRDSPCRDQRPRSIPRNGPVHFYPVRFIMKLDNHQINGTDGHDWNKTDKLFIWLVIAGPALRQNPRGSPTGKTLCGSHCNLPFFEKSFSSSTPHAIPTRGVGDGGLRFQPKASLSQPFLLIQTVRFAPSVD
ncbi:hypothetical protein L3X38_027665 [Prunus dulcis]|uniref:Uncharacterized protein n=1 Tax=Prunus dulcis TaxID=3755 RepID=A0AAD4Z1D2_PRUDU|nr:hypothetical protein L3X38_027665 [Prunus dulcis]